jgi:hypothetical protein
VFWILCVRELAHALYTTRAHTPGLLCHVGRRATHCHLRAMTSRITHLTRLIARTVPVCFGISPSSADSSDDLPLPTSPTCDAIAIALHTAHARSRTD